MAPLEEGSRAQEESAQRDVERRAPGRTRRPPRHPAGDRLEVAQAVLRTRTERPGGTPPGWPTPFFFPLRSSWWSRPWPVSCRRVGLKPPLLLSSVKARSSAFASLASYTPLCQAATLAPRPMPMAGEDLDAGVPSVDFQRDSRVRRQWRVQVIDPAFEHGEELERPRSTGRGLQVGPALAAVVHVVQVELSKTAANLARTSGLRASETRTFHSTPATRSRCCRTDPVRSRGCRRRTLGGVGDRGGGDGAVDGDLDVERRGRARPEGQTAPCDDARCEQARCVGRDERGPRGLVSVTSTPVAVHSSPVRRVTVARTLLRRIRPGARRG